MERRMIGKCPVCGGVLLVTELGCKECKTSIRGEFRPSPFLRLSSEEERFLVLFLKFRGSISEVGKEVGISYPTARNRFEEILSKLGIREEVGKQSRILEILDMLEQKEINVEEALKLIEEKK